MSGRPSFPLWLLRLAAGILLLTWPLWAILAVLVLVAYLIAGAW